MAGMLPPSSRRLHLWKPVCLALAFAVLENVSVHSWSFAWRRSSRPKPFAKKSPFDAALTGTGQKGVWKAPDASAGGGPTSKLSKIPVQYLATFQHDEDCDNAEATLDFGSVGGRTVRVTAVDAEVAPRPRRRKVYVQGVHPDVPSRKVEEFLSTAGELVNVRRSRDVRFGEVRFTSSNLAYDVKMELDGSRLHGKVLRMELDCTTESLNVVLVHGLNPVTTWQDLVNHVCSVLPRIERVKWCRIHGGGRTARVCFAEQFQAERALKSMDRSVVQGLASVMRVYPPYNREVDPAQIRVSRFASATEAALAKHFESCGTVDLVEFLDEELPPEFREPAQL